MELPEWARKKLDRRFTDLEERASFRMTGDIKEDLSPPGRTSEQVSNGWLFSEASTAVFKASSTGTAHGYDWDVVTAQGPKRLFSTRLLALRALRRAVEKETATRLRNIDLEIKDEELATSWEFYPDD